MIAFQKALEAGADGIEEYHLEDKVIISSFNHYSILRMKKIAPALKYGLLTETWLVHPGAYTKALGVACYHPYYGSHQMMLFMNYKHRISKLIRLLSMTQTASND